MQWYPTVYVIYIGWSWPLRLADVKYIGILKNKIKLEDFRWTEKTKKIRPCDLN
jgi:hypothetical protein